MSYEERKQLEIARLERICNNTQSPGERLDAAYKIYWISGIHSAYLAEVLPVSFRAQWP